MLLLSWLALDDICPSMFSWYNGLHVGLAAQQHIGHKRRYIMRAPSSARALGWWNFCMDAVTHIENFLINFKWSLTVVCSNNKSLIFLASWRYDYKIFFATKHFPSFSFAPTQANNIYFLSIIGIKFLISSQFVFLFVICLSALILNFLSLLLRTATNFFVTFDFMCFFRKIVFLTNFRSLRIIICTRIWANIFSTT